jgi:nucleoside-diphosphate-sugar epimerase
MKVLIIGGTGLISTAITGQLVERGDEVTLFNRGQTEPRIPAGVKQVHGDRKDYGAFESAMASLGTFDCVIDMICFLPEEAESDVRAFSGRAGRFIFCSTVDVYSRPASRYPYTEDEPHHPVSEYGRNKAACEALFREAHDEGRLSVTTIRPAYTYGEGGTIIHTFGWSTTYIDRIRRGKPVVVHGDGSSFWVCCHIEDAARAFLGAMDNPDAAGRAYHVTGEEWMPWNTYHRKVAEALGAPEPRLVAIPTDLLAAGAPKRSGIVSTNFRFSNIFDNAAAHADLGFRYTIPWVEGVRRTVTWLDEHGRIEDSDTDPFDDRLIAAWERLGNQMITEDIE